jgi:HK97 gp10 family phage protein
MAEQTGIKVKGLKSSIKALQEIGVPANEIKLAGSEAGEIVAQEARGITPVRSGNLRNSIRVSKALNRVSVSAGNNGRVRYANPIHWGWGRKHIRPQPFFVNALATTREQVYQRYYQNLDKLIASNATKGTDE